MYVLIQFVAHLNISCWQCGKYMAETTQIQSPFRHPGSNFQRQYPKVYLENQFADKELFKMKSNVIYFLPPFGYHYIGDT